MSTDAKELLRECRDLLELWPLHEQSLGTNAAFKLVERIDTLLSQPSAGEGTVMVPREPTVVQVNAGVDADDLRTGFETVKHIYRAMIAVTPFASGGEESV